MQREVAAVAAGLEAAVCYICSTQGSCPSPLLIYAIALFRAFWVSVVLQNLKNEGVLFLEADCNWLHVLWEEAQVWRVKE